MIFVYFLLIVIAATVNANVNVTAIAIAVAVPLPARRVPPATVLPTSVAEVIITSPVNVTAAAPVPLSMHTAAQCFASQTPPTTLTAIYSTPYIQNRTEQNRTEQNGTD